MKKQLTIILLIIFNSIKLVAQTISGIDVSHDQGTIDWSMVYAANVKFAFAKCSEGLTGFDDATFSTNMTNGNNAGVKMGAYYIAVPTDDPTASAEHFLSLANINGFIGPNHLPPALDLEPSYVDGLTKSALSTWVLTWMQYVQNNDNDGVAPIIYTTGEEVQNRLNASLNIYGLWIATYPSNPTTPPTNLGVWNTWLFNQYAGGSSPGTVSGINVPVDLDVFNGTQTDFNNLIGVNTCTPVTITTSPQNQIATCGNTATFNISVNGTPPYSYFWYNGIYPGGTLVQTTINASSSTSSYPTPTLSCADNGNHYYCNVTNCSSANGISNNAATLTVNCTPSTVTVSGGGTFCSSATLTASGGSGGTIYWQGTTNGGTSTATASSSQTVSSSGTYYFRAYNGCSWGTQGSATVTISNTTPGTVTVSGGGTFCSSATLTASGGSGGTIYWQGTTNGGTSTATASSSQTVSSSGTYYFRAYNGCSWGTQGSATVSISPTVAPTISISANQTTLCSGATITFIAASTDTGTTPTYQWKVNGGIQGSNSSTFSSTTLKSGDVVSCILTSNAPCANPTNKTSNSITMVNGTVTPSVTISANPSGAICQGQFVTLTASATNEGNTPTYQWKVNGKNTGTNNVTDTSSAFANGDIITCEMTSSLSCANPSSVPSTNSITITTLPAPPKPTIFKFNNNILNASTINNGTYQWYLNGSPIQGATSQNDTVKQDGKYSVRVFDSNGCASPMSDDIAVITGISSVNAGNGDINVYPNPNNGTFEIQFTNSFVNAELQIFNSIGQNVYHNSLESGIKQKEISLGSLPEGIYFIQIISNEGIQTKKFVVAK